MENEKNIKRDAGESQREKELREQMRSLDDEILTLLVRKLVLRQELTEESMKQFGDMIARLRTGKLAKFIDANQLIEGIVFTVVGLLMTIFTDNAFRFIVIVALGTVVAFQFVYTIKKLREDHWNFVREKTRVYIFLVVATLFAVILVKNEALFIVGSGICGGWLLVVAYRSFLAFKQSEVRDFAFWKNFVKSILYSGCGIFIILAPKCLEVKFQNKILE